MRIKSFVPLICASLLFSSCSKVVPVAYTCYKAVGDEYVYYSSDMYGAVDSHIMVYESKAKEEEDHKIPALEFSFQRSMGVDEIEGQKYTLVDVTSLYIVNITILKSRGLYSENKKIYLNNEALEPSKSSSIYYYEDEHLVVMRFQNFGLKRTNPKNTIDTSIVNILEYRI